MTNPDDRRDVAHRPQGLAWPEAPTCHGGFSALGPIAWRPPNRAPSKVAGSEHWAAYVPVRTCNYCGSMHPEDLLAALRNPDTRVEVADRKYGWPHKVYVDFPTPAEDVDLRVWAGGRTGPKLQCPHCQFVAPGFVDPPVCPCGKSRFARGLHGSDGYVQIGTYREDQFAPVGPISRGKWYNEHFGDIVDPATFGVLAHELWERTGVLFTRTGDRVEWVEHARSV